MHVRVDRDTLFRLAHRLFSGLRDIRGCHVCKQKGSRMNQMEQRNSVGGADGFRIKEDPTLPARLRFIRRRDLAEGEVA